MSLDPQLFLLQWTDSALPIGSYSHSWGLETVIQDQQLTSGQALETYLQGLLRISLVPQEGMACYLAHHYAQTERPAAWIRLQHQFNAIPRAHEIQQASLQMGNRLQHLAQRVWGLQCPSLSHSGSQLPHHCLVFGWVCANAGLPAADTLRSYWLTTLTGLVAAGVKLIPLGHTEGQQILAKLSLQISCEVERVLSSCPAQQPMLSSMAWLQERDSQRHQHLYSRLFQS
ncbi:MAG: urease accessory protein UreF [Synechococcaceae cyanobacterium SM2_3_1]|nr:urease accessory protein UreF [Synechococcaceae cyanobacterium SM2_3_1]